MLLDQFKDNAPEYAKDIKMNLQTLLSIEAEHGLNAQQVVGMSLTAAYATRSTETIALIREYAETVLDEAQLNAAKTAATLMAMTNIYYRGLHMLEDKAFMQLPAKLRMMKLASPGIPKTDFELYTFTASVVTGCEMCVNAHAATLEKEGVAKIATQTGIRIAAVINAVATVLEIERQ